MGASRGFSIGAWEPGPYGWRSLIVKLFSVVVRQNLCALGHVRQIGDVRMSQKVAVLSNSWAPGALTYPATCAAETDLYRSARG